jgi:hypothetical protein
MPISQFSLTGLREADYGAKKTSKWHKFLGYKTGDKICHLSMYTLEGACGAGLRRLLACELAAKPFS